MRVFLIWLVVTVGCIIVGCEKAPDSIESRFVGSDDFKVELRRTPSSYPNFYVITDVKTGRRYLSFGHGMIELNEAPSK